MSPVMSYDQNAYAVEDLVTGEAVALELPVAGVPVRLASGLIDVLASLVLLVMCFVGVSVLTGAASDAVVGAASILVTVGCLVAFPVAFETLTRGRTLGKLALGTRTVRDDGGPITFRHALVRGLVGFVEIYVFSGAPAIVCALVSKRSKRLGDLAAGTYVLTERTRLRFMPAPPMPPGLASWAAAADMSPLPDGLAVASRQFLTRAEFLSAESRTALSRDLRKRIDRHIAPAPDRSWPDEAVIAAVLAERGRRDAERLDREACLVARVLPRDPLAPGT